MIKLLKLKACIFFIVAGSSGNTCSEEYRGSSAFSEPESRAVRNFIQGRRGQIRSHMRQNDDQDVEIMF